MTHELPFEDEGVIDTSEQTTPSQQIAANEKQFDPAHPPVAQQDDPHPELVTPKTRWHQADDEHTSEQDAPQTSVHEAYPTDV